MEITVDALRIDSVNGIKMAGKSMIGGKMGVTILFELRLEVGKVKNKKSKAIISFKAYAKADGYFGGDFVINSDEKGLFVQPVLKFSGVMLIAEVEGEIGWWKSNFKIEERVVDKEEYYMEKKYFT